MKLADRMEKIPPYVFAAVAQRIREKKAQGVDILNLGIGSPDMGPPNWITEEMIEASLVEEHHRYPGYVGSPVLRQAWASYYQSRFGVTLDADRQVLPLIGSKEGLAHVALALVDPGDVVLVPDPGYPVYNMSTIMAGGTTYPTPLLEENGFLPDLDAIPPEVLERTVAMWLNYPNNPTGAIAPMEFYEKVVAYAKKYDFAVLSDNPYADITFDGYRAPSFLEAPGAMDVAIEINSLSKTYNMAGWRIGVAVGNTTLVNALLRVKSNVDTGIFYPLQAGAAAALTGDQSWIAQRNLIYQERRDVAAAGLRAAGFTVNVPSASLYLWPRVPEGYDANDLAWHLFDKAQVWITPGEAFGAAGKPFMRLALCTSADALTDALARVKQVM
ncbi:MAG: LL-diaminopimelate aminotransferase [Ardenticatenaceae bacterium]